MLSQNVCHDLAYMPNGKSMFFYVGKLNFIFYGGPVGNHLSGALHDG